MKNRTWWLGLFAALTIGLAPMVGCENEVEEPLPGGGEIEREPGEVEIESPTGEETEIEREEDVL